MTWPDPRVARAPSPPACSKCLTRPHLSGLSAIITTILTIIIITNYRRHHDIVLQKAIEPSRPLLGATTALMFLAPATV